MPLYIGISHLVPPVTQYMLCQVEIDGSLSSLMMQDKDSVSEPVDLDAAY